MRARDTLGDELQSEPPPIEDEVAVRGGEHPAPDAQPRGERRARTEERRDHLRELSARRLVRPRRPRRQKGAADGADKSSTMWSGSRQGNRGQGIHAILNPSSS